MCKHNIKFPNCQECTKDLRIFLKLTDLFGVNTANEWVEKDEHLASCYGLNDYIQEDCKICESENE